MDKHLSSVTIEKNSFVDQGDGVVIFPNKQVITDGSIQKNGTRYDIPSMKLDEFKGLITADHVDMLQSIIGKVINVAKIGNQVVIDGIDFAVKQNPLARLAYNLMVGGYPPDLSIESYGNPPDDEGIYKDSNLVGLSAVVVGNNNSAKINQVVQNSIEQAKQDGLDAKVLNGFLAEESNIKKENNNMSEVKEKVEERQEEKIEEKVEEKAETEKEEVKETDNSQLIDQVKEVIGESIKPLQEKIDAVEKNAFDKSAKEPEFKKTEEKADKSYESTDWKDRTVEQIESARRMLQSNDSESAKKLREINEINLEGLKKKGLVRNALTIADFGNFVIPKEMLSEIVGARNDYTPLVNAVNWQETLSTQMAWLSRSGDIDMQPVENCDDGADGNLKPVSEYTASINTADLEELAAVTPVCNAATRFLAADLLGDVAAGYRNDYDRKRAQLIIAKLELAVEGNGNSVTYNTSSGVNALSSFLDLFGEISDVTANGVYIMSRKSLVELKKEILKTGGSDVYNQIFFKGEDGVPTIDGNPYITVSSDLLPTLNTAETKSFTVNGVAVTVNHAVFFVNLASNFAARVSGGLQYDLSTDAAYEVESTVKSAFQRNELVLRGSFFRGGAVRDTSQVSGLLAPGVS